MKSRIPQRLLSVFFFASTLCFFSSATAADSDSIPIFPDLVYEYRITELNNLTPIELEYNKHVRRYIDVYTVEKREHFAKIVGKAKRYFPMIEEKLDEYGLPHELKYLAIIESALDPFAVSSSGAVGLWQFKLNTSRMFDLEVNSYIDERRDPYKSTIAACKYLKYLYDTYENWQLALASYNGGPGVVRKAIARSDGERSFWKLYPHLPGQTKSYVPAFIAVNYAMNYMKEHNIEPKELKHTHHETDTVNISAETSFQKIAEILNMEVSVLKDLNPMYRRNVIPKLNQPSHLILPEDKVVQFLENEEEIFNGAKGEFTSDDEPEKQKTKLVHRVEKGEYFHKIAMKYNCSIEDLREWNDLENNDLQVGQKLDIWVDPVFLKKIEEEQTEVKKENPGDTNRRVVYYTIKKGDTIWSIADKFNCDSISELLEANEIQDEADIEPGKKLKIYLNH
ncbi:MAG: LysM peptidoglycan-binding domain-containing protein [Bacteroidota bacterium]